MAQPQKGRSKLADSASLPQIADRGAAVTATTATQVAVTDSLDGATFTGTALLTSSTPTVDELEAIAGMLGLAVNAAGTDIAALIVTVDALISRMEAHGLIADN